MLKRTLFAACLALLGLAAWGVTADAQSVLKVSRGLKSNNVAVEIDRAIVLDSRVQFVEVSVANPEIADVQVISNKSIYIFGRRRGTTSLTLLGENGRLITNVLIRVEADHSELKERLKQILPNEPIEVRTANGGLILSGVVSGKAKIDKAMSLARAYGGDAVTNMMSVGGTQQVMLKVKVAEIERSAGKDLGVSLGLRGSTGRAAPQVVTGNSFSVPDGGGARPFPTEPSGGTTGDGLTRIIPVAPAFAGAFGAIFTIANSFILDVQIDALEQKGFAKTLSEPNLVALSGQSAEFLAGGEVPIPVQGSDGEISVSFKPVGVNVNFLPQVLDNDLINVSVSAAVSEVDPAVSTSSGGVEIVGFQTRRASTVVELRDGQAFAIAGLLQESFQDTVSQVPWLGDLPVLGTLFRSANFQRGESELVIFVSVHLVTPVNSEDELTLPTDRIRIPNEAELFLFGRTDGGPTFGASGSGLENAGFDGEYGYVVE
ncbi:MAG: type II and III secretion system protein family protein [Pseudomonadota bacterium]